MGEPHPFACVSSFTREVPESHPVGGTDPMVQQQSEPMQYNQAGSIGEEEAWRGSAGPLPAEAVPSAGEHMYPQASLQYNEQQQPLPVEPPLQCAWHPDHVNMVMLPRLLCGADCLVLYVFPCFQ